MSSHLDTFEARAVVALLEGGGRASAQRLWGHYDLSATAIDSLLRRGLVVVAPDGDYTLTDAGLDAVMSPLSGVAWVLDLVTRPAEAVALRAPGCR